MLSKPHPITFDSKEGQDIMKKFRTFQRDMAIEAYLTGVFTKEKMIGQLQSQGFDNFKIIKILKLVKIMEKQYKQRMSNAVEELYSKPNTSIKRIGTKRITRDKASIKEV